MYQGRSLKARKRTGWELGETILAFIRLWTTTLLMSREQCKQKSAPCATERYNGLCTFHSVELA